MVSLNRLCLYSVSSQCSVNRRQAPPPHHPGSRPSFADLIRSTNPRVDLDSTANCETYKTRPIRPTHIQLPNPLLQQQPKQSFSGSSDDNNSCQWRTYFHGPPTRPQLAASSVFVPGRPAIPGRDHITGTSLQYLHGSGSAPQTTGRHWSLQASSPCPSPAIGTHTHTQRAPLPSARLLARCRTESPTFSGHRPAPLRIRWPTSPRRPPPHHRAGDRRPVETGTPTGTAEGQQGQLGPGARNG